MKYPFDLSLADLNDEIILFPYFDDLYRKINTKIGVQKTMYQPQQFIEDLDLNITSNDALKSEIKQFEIEVKQVYQNKT